MKNLVYISTPAYYYEEPDRKNLGDIVLSNFDM